MRLVATQNHLGVLNINTDFFWFLKKVLIGQNGPDFYQKVKKAFRKYDPKFYQMQKKMNVCRYPALKK